MSDSDTPLPPRLPAWIGWTSAGCLLLGVLFFAAKSFNVRNELQLALASEQAARLEAGTLKNLLEAERILSRAQLDRLAASERLVAELRGASALSRLTLSVLKPASPSSDAVAVVIWSPEQQSGLLVTSRLPAPASGHSHQLWLKTLQSPAPVDGGVLATDTDRTAFKPVLPISGTPSFFISLERQGGASTPEGSVILAGD